MKFKTILILFILIIPFISANEMWLNPYETKEIGNLSINADIDFTWQTVFMYINGKKKLLKLDECTKEGIYQFCFKDKVHDLTKNKGGIYEGNRKPAILFEYEKIIPDIELTYSYTKEKPYINERDRVNIELLNVGKETAEKIRYVEVIPSDFEIKSKSNELKFINNELIWEGTLTSNKKKTLYYSYVPKKAGKYNISLNLTYSHLGENYFYNQNPRIIESQELIKINATINKEIFKINESFYINLSLFNQGNLDSDLIKIKFNIPNSLTNIKSNKLKQESKNLFSWEGYLKQNISEEILLNGIIKEPSNFEIIYEIELSIKGQKYEISDSLNGNVPSNGIELLIKVPKDPLLINQLAYVEVLLKNNDENNSFYDISCDLMNHTTSTLTKNLSRLYANKSTTIFSFAFIAESKSKESIHSIEVNCKYNAGFDTIFESNSREIIKIIHPDSNTINVNISEEFDDGDFAIGGFDEEKTQENKKIIKEEIQENKEINNLSQKPKQIKISLLKKILMFFGII